MASATKRPVLRFVLTFCALMAPFTVFFYAYLVHTRLFDWYLRLNAGASAALLRVMGQTASSRGTMLEGPGSALEVRYGCDAILPTALFVAAVLASPVRFRLKTPAVLLGSAALLTINLVRIISLYFARIHFPDWFEWMHLDFWQPAFIFLALVFWVGWALRAVRIMASGDATA